jgi:LppX_LprAFG lipoprotein
VKRTRTFSRGLMTAVMVLMLGGLLPLAVGAAAPPVGVDPRLIITRLGDQPPAGVSSTPGAAASLQSFHFVAQGMLTISGEPDKISLAMNGDFAMPDRLHATVTLTDSASNDTIPPIEFVVVGSTPYVHLTGDLSPAGKDLWVLIDNPDGMGGMFPAGMMPNLANLPPIPTQTQTVGDETINGTLTTHMRTTIDATALLGGMSKSARPSKLTVDTWTGKADNLPRRVAVNGNLSIDPNALAAQLGQETVSGARPVNANFTFTVDFTNLNAPVTITAPASFVKLSTLLNQ